MTTAISANQFRSYVSSFSNTSYSFRERMDALKAARAESLRNNPHLPAIAIFGGGPAGLSRAIDALISGNPVTVFEKRQNSGRGRENTVALKDETIPLLKYYGVYQCLLEKGLIFPEANGWVNVRLKDLEEAMKAVTSELTQDSIVKYDSQLERIIPHPNAKADLVIRSEGRLLQLNAVDVVVVAEGAHGSTSELLGNRRITVLPSIPVIAAIFKDDRPAITGASSFFQYVGKTLSNTVTSVYYYSIFLFKCFFQGEHVFNKKRRIAGSLILKTPHQNYLGSGLSKSETKEMMRLSQKLKSAKQELEAASAADLPLLQQKVDEAQTEWDAYIRYWTAMSFCFANILSIFRAVLGGEKMPLAAWLPFDHASIAEIGADKSSAYSGTVGLTSYLSAGDTVATVDPTTGLGCNTAVQTATDFHDYMRGLNSHQDVASLQRVYNNRCEKIVSKIHTESIQMRRLYRPDAVLPPNSISVRV